MSFYTGDHRANIPTHTTQEVKARMKKTHTPNWDDKGNIPSEGGQVRNMDRQMVDWTQVLMLQNDKQYIHKHIHNTSPQCGGTEFNLRMLGSMLIPLQRWKLQLSCRFMALSAFESFYDNYHNTSLPIVSPKNLPLTHDIHICCTCKKNKLKSSLPTSERICHHSTSRHTCH